MEAFPKPRHQYIYTPRYGQRGLLTYAGQKPNGALPAGVMPGGYSYGVGYSGVGGYAAGGYYPGAHNSYYPQTYGASYYPGYNNYYGGYHNTSMYGSMYPLANFYTPYQRSYYNTIPSYGYTAHAYPPGPTTTTTTTYHVTNSQVPVHNVGPSVQAATCNHGAAREDIQLESRRMATERGAYAPRRIKPADALRDDPFWCKERHGDWHLRTYYQIENECYPGRWLMDAEAGYLVFHRD